MYIYTIVLEPERDMDVDVYTEINKKIYGNIGKSKKGTKEFLVASDEDKQDSALESSMDIDDDKNKENKEDLDDEEEKEGDIEDEDEDDEEKEEYDEEEEDDLEDDDEDDVDEEDEDDLLYEDEYDDVFSGTNEYIYVIYCVCVI